MDGNAENALGDHSYLNYLRKRKRVKRYQEGRIKTPILIEIYNSTPLVSSLHQALSQTQKNVSEPQTAIESATF